VQPAPPAAAPMPPPPVADADASASAAASAADDPITFEPFKQQKVDAEKEKKERIEGLEKKAKAEAEAARRRARKAEKIVIDNEDGLDMKGYKIRADGSKTSYFDRQVDEETKRLLDEQKKPKRLSVGGAEEAAPTAAESSQAAGSAWNNGTTWEEKDVSEWAKAEIEATLGSATAEHAAVAISVTKVKSVEGHASVVASRGAQRYIYEYALELEWKAKTLPIAAEGIDETVTTETPATTKLASGTLHLPEVMPSAMPGVVAADDCMHAFKSEVKDAALKPAVMGALEALKADVRARLCEFDSHFRASKRI